MVEPNITAHAHTQASSSRPLSRWPRRLLWSAAGFVVFVLLAACTGLLWLRSATRASLPALDGDLHITGLSSPVTVRRDAHGVPHIDAASQTDLFVAQGYITAQDRLWQMDTFRRNANGELAEILGPALVKHDRAQRVLQFRNTANRIYANLPPEERAYLDDYALGVNLYIRQHQHSLPVEFRLLHYRPQPWSGADSLSIGMMMVQMLDTHWDVKLARERIAAELRNPRLEADLYPVGSWRDHPPTGVLLDLSQPHPEPQPSNDEEDDDRNQTRTAPPSAPQAHEDLRALHTLLGLPACASCASGSNNWVISGQHTASGKPLLSNDMHLEFSEPSIWYMADLRAPGFHAAGVTLPGMPFVVAGHNEHVAWGFTALYADVQDLYIEKLDGKGHYFQAGTGTTPGAWKPLGIDHEVIRVRGGRDVRLDVQLTNHGPLLTPLFKRDTRPIALQWTLYDSTLNALPLYPINVASNWTEFSAALAQWCWPTQNVVYADDQGHIAYHAIGRIPLRPAGLVGVPIHDSAHEWQGYIPFESMPSAVDPPSGLLATANSRVTTDSSPYPLSLEWADPYRAERIYKTLQGRDQLRPEDMLALQTDIYSEVDQEMGQRFAYAIDHASKTDVRLRAAADLMRTWDGRLNTDSAAAAVVTQARKALWPLLLRPRLGRDAADYVWAESNFAEEEIVMHARPEWLPPGYTNWNDLLTEAVRRGLDAGKAPENVTAWSYGSVSTIDIEHPLAELLPFISRMAGTGPQPISGDTTTVKQINRNLGPSQRFTMDWSNMDKSTENIVLGESSNPYSPYFRDQWNDWYNGTTFALPFTPAAVTAHARHTLRLLP